MNIDFNDARPIYEQIIDEVKRSIARGELEPGDKLPSQREMARKVEVNPNTIQRAYREMENLNLVETRRGMGTFIAESNEVIEEINEEMAREAINRFIDEMFSLGFSHSEVLKIIEKELERKVKNKGKKGDTQVNLK